MAGKEGKARGKDAEDRPAGGKRPRHERAEYRYQQDE